MTIAYGPLLVNSVVCWNVVKAFWRDLSPVGTVVPLAVTVLTDTFWFVSLKAP